MGEGAVREVAQVYERIKMQQPLLLLHSSSSQQQQLAHNLLSEALRALNLALSVMKQQQQPVLTPARSVKAEPQQLSPPSPASADSQAIATSTATRSAKRRRSSVMMEGKRSSSWVHFTTVPYEDGYEWRKYGEKKINGTSYTRSYFRCTYKDDTGCLATKHVQQKDNNIDQPMFQVIYNNNHTCNNCTTTTAAKNKNSRSSNTLALLGCCNSSEGVTIIRSPNGHHAAMDIKQEQPPVLMPPLLEISALPFDGTAPPSMTSSCISGESWGEYSAGDDMAQMAAAEASAGDDLLYDPELFVLCTSFRVY